MLRSRFIGYALFLVIGIFSGALMAEPQVLKVAEMESLPLDSCGAMPEGVQVTEGQRADWQRLFPMVANLVSDEMIVDLSRWAIAETKQYHYRPGAVPAIHGLEAGEKCVVWEATLADLPSHHRLVKRYLKVYLVGPRIDGERLYVNQLIYTIRGERFE